MNQIELLKKKVSQLGWNELCELSEHIWRLQLERDPKLKKEWARRIDDKSEGAWLSLEEVEARIAEQAQIDRE